MKETVNVKRALSFGSLKSVNAGQRQVVYEPQVVATSTDGGFRITPIISKLLMVESGENIAFLNNIDTIDEAIRNQTPEVVAFCEENGLDVTSPEAMIAIHKAFDLWAIYKGVPEFDAKGNRKTITERLTKKDRMKYVAANLTDMLDAADKSDDENLIAALHADGISEADQIEILAPFVQARELPKFSGSKVANPAGLTGVGVTLTFTDSNVWAQLKGDLGEMANKMNRVFDVDVNDILDVEVWNGYETVTVKALVLGKYEDVRPIDRKAGSAE